MLTIRFAGTDRFQTTPLDYLIVSLAVVMPFLPEMTVGTVPVSLLAAKLIVLFFFFRTTAPHLFICGNSIGLGVGLDVGWIGIAGVVVVIRLWKRRQAS